MSDTVGFIRKLPHNLVASFRTTLSDITDADLIIKVVDISANDYKGHIATIENTLNYLKADKCLSILVFNKPIYVYICRSVYLVCRSNSELLSL